MAGCAAFCTSKGNCMRVPYQDFIVAPLNYRFYVDPMIARKIIARDGDTYPKADRIAAVTWQLIANSFLIIPFILIWLTGSWWSLIALILSPLLHNANTKTCTQLIFKVMYEDEDIYNQYTIFKEVEIQPKE